MSGRSKARGAATRAAGIVSAALIALLISCAEAPDETATATEGKAAPEAETVKTGPDPASGVLTQEDNANATPPDPKKIGLEPASTTITDPALTAETSGSPASVYWGSRGRRVDAKSPWASVGGDGIHDRGSGATTLLQSPRSAFRKFPRANSGNLVDWVAALDEGHIKPRGGARLEVLDQDVLLVDTKGMPYVVFPHRPHTEQLVCRNCHDWLFKKQAGATDITMAAIARGRSCGLCHGKVAFPATECFRCHSGPRPR